MFSIKFNQTRTHLRIRSTIFVRADEMKNPAKDTLILEVNLAHRRIGMSFVGITVFVKNENMLELIIRSDGNAFFC